MCVLSNVPSVITNSNKEMFQPHALLSQVLNLVGFVLYANQHRPCSGLLAYLSSLEKLNCFLEFYSLLRIWVTNYEGLSISTDWILLSTSSCIYMNET